MPMKVLKCILSSVFAFSIANVAKADLWSEAQDAFDQRENNRAKVAEARSKYLQLAEQSSGANRIKAVTQLGRLALYEGEMLNDKTQTAERNRIFGDCWCKSVNGGTCATPGFVELINPSVVGENAAYYYVKGACLAYWGEVQPLLVQIRWVGKVDEIITQGKARADMRFEGAGIHRLAAAFYANEKTRALGYFRPEQALESARTATAMTDAYPGDDQVSGPELYENWRTEYLALKALGRSDDANSLADEKITEMEEAEALGLLPESRIPESKFVIRCLKNERAGRECHAGL
jgi:hypothetical protein